MFSQRITCKENIRHIIRNFARYFVSLFENVHPQGNFEVRLVERGDCGGFSVDGGLVRESGVI